MINLITRIKRSLCKHPKNKTTAGYWGGHMYMNCTKCGKQWKVY
jgi:hypothetical protein